MLKFQMSAGTKAEQCTKAKTQDSSGRHIANAHVIGCFFPHL